MFKIYNDPSPRRVRELRDSPQAHAVRVCYRERVNREYDDAVGTGEMSAVLDAFGIHAPDCEAFSFERGICAGRIA